MTKQEQAALEELHLTPEQFEERKAKVALMLAQGLTAGNAEAIARYDAAKPTRKPRSDKGVPKGPKIAQKTPSTLSTQCARIKDLYETRASCVAELETISDEIDDLDTRRAGLIGSLDGLNEEIESAWLELQGKRA